MQYFHPETLNYVLRLTVALVCGYAIGLERQWRHGMAGTRTHGLVSVGGAAFVTAGLMNLGDVTSPARMASYVVSGVGFLCAGAIFREGATVKGLNTAATLWCAAAVGVLAGFGDFTLGLILTLYVVLTNAVLRPLAHKWHPWKSVPPVETLYEIRVMCGEFIEEHMRSLLLTTISQAPVALQAVHSLAEPGTGQVQLSAELTTEGPQNHEVERIALRLSMEPGISGVSWAVIVREGQS
jgi:putative Mg2+ transporter-C (MgtC) family protein